MRYKWKYDLQNEIGRILFTASSIARGLYGREFYYVLPNLEEKYKESITYFPKSLLNSDKRFWKHVTKQKYQVPAQENEETIRNLVEESIKDFKLIEEELIEKRRQEWEKIAPRFDDFIRLVFKGTGLDVSEVHIFPTQFGSRGSYWYANKDKLETINLYYRIDSDIWVIAHGIIAMIVHFLHFKNYFQKDENNLTSSGEWFSKERITDFLIQRTSLSKLFPDYKPIQDLSKVEGSAKLANASTDYLAELGFSTRNPLVVEAKGIYDLTKKSYLKKLSNQEARILALFVNNPNVDITYDQISDTLWGEDSTEKFSLYYLNKLIHQIRVKLKLNGINAEMIKTKRGVGYVYFP
ncbi:MAG: helix-turn-helix domain-containing protein [Patescibacteria group bacterium]|nr:helix-turn-helix domain-containing protein [Patescibacteria group bacterium]